MPSRCPKAEAERLETMLHFERGLYSQGFDWVAGVDEAGAGPLAGPVYAAAVVLPPGCAIAGVDDSKKVRPKLREALAAEIKRAAQAYAVAAASVQEIDRLNIRQACLLAMRRALLSIFTQLGEAALPGLHVLVDAHRLAGLPCEQTALIGGDGRSLSIAAASILAKVGRDQQMVQLDQEHPGYGFAANKGYGTAAHLEALARLGPCAAHRRSFAPVRRAAG
jgi:ribonuclease HII